MMNIAVYVHIIAIVFLVIATSSFKSLHRVSYRYAVISTPYASLLSPMYVSLVPRDISYNPSQVEITKFIGTVDVLIRKDDSDNNSNVKTTLCRVYEAKTIIGKCVLKEFSTDGRVFGDNELFVTRKLTSKWNSYVSNLLNTTAATTSTTASTTTTSLQLQVPPFQILVGSLVTDARITDEEFVYRWTQKFPRLKPPQPNNLWLIYKWDDASFKTLKSFPALPQIIEGLDYIRPNVRLQKRLRFIRKILKLSLLSLDVIHRNGYCHNSISSQSIWLSSTNQLDIDVLNIRMTDFGISQLFTDLGPTATAGALNDLYQLGFVFLELIINSFTEDNVGARFVRGKLDGKEYKPSIFDTAKDIDYTQLSQNEIQNMFEQLCASDFATLRSLMQSISSWSIAFGVLEDNEGALWKLVFTLLTNGRLYDNSKEKKVRLTSTMILRDFKRLFVDV